MSFPNIPDVKPEILIDKEKSLDLLISGVAFEELGIAHIINAEAEKIQFVLGTLEKSSHYKHHSDGNTNPPTLDELLQANKSVNKMLKKVIEKEIMIDFILEDAIELSTTSSTTTTSTTSTTTTTTKKHVMPEED